MPLRTDAFLHRETLHTDAWFTQRRFYKENLLRTDAFTYRNFCAERLLHKETYTQSRIGAQKKHRETVTRSSFYTLQNRTFTTVVDLSPSFPAKRSLKFHMEAAKMLAKAILSGDQLKQLPVCRMAQWFTQALRTQNTLQLPCRTLRYSPVSTLPLCNCCLESFWCFNVYVMDLNKTETPRKPVVRRWRKFQK